MKKSIFGLFGLLFPLAIQAQNATDSTRHRKWEFAFGAGFGTTWREKGNFLDANGLVVSVEPSYNISKSIAVGARAEYVFIKDYLSGQDASIRIKAKAFPSFSITGDLTPWNGKVKPFVGIGAGLYFLGTAAETSGSSESNLQTRFGLSPRIGVKLGKISALVEIHIIDEKTLYNRDYATLKVRYSL